MRRCSTGKVCHPSRVAACITMKKLKNKGLNVYKCRSCGFWHLGNSNQDFKIQKRISQLLGD